MCLKLLEASSKLVLLTANTVVGLVALWLLGYCVYFYADTGASAFATNDAVAAITIAAVIILAVSFIGCCAAHRPRGHHTWQSLYIGVLLLAIVCQAAIIGFASYLSGAMGEIHDTRFNNTDAIRADLVNYLHDETAALYEQGQCQGGYVTFKPTKDSVTIGFTGIKCDLDAVEQTFDALVGISSPAASTEKRSEVVENFANCTQFDYDQKEFNYKPSNTFNGTVNLLPLVPVQTQVFCHLNKDITDYVKAYAKVFEWFGFALLGLELLLLSASCYLVCRRAPQGNALLPEHQLSTAYQAYPGNNTARV